MCLPLLGLLDGVETVDFVTRLLGDDSALDLCFGVCLGEATKVNVCACEFGPSTFEAVFRLREDVGFDGAKLLTKRVPWCLVLDTCRPLRVETMPPLRTVAL